MSCFGITSLNGSRTFGFGSASASDGGVPPDVEVPVTGIPTDYLSRYDFNGDLLDKSPNLVHANSVGANTFPDGRKLGTQALSLDGGSKVTSASPIQFSGTEQVTISLWFKTTHKTNGVVLSNQGSVYNFFKLETKNSSSVKMSATSGLDGNEAYKQAGSIDADTWQHIVVIYDRAQLNKDEVITIYLNGKLSQVSSQYGAAARGEFVDTLLRIGYQYDYEMPYVGLMQDLRIYKRRLTLDEITALFNE